VTIQAHRRNPFSRRLFTSGVGRNREPHATWPLGCIDSNRRQSAQEAIHGWVAWILVHAMRVGLHSGPGGVGVLMTDSTGHCGQAGTYQRSSYSMQALINNSGQGRGVERRRDLPGLSVLIGLLRSRWDT